DALAGIPAIVLWNLDAVNWFDTNSTLKLFNILKILNSVLKTHCGCISINFEIAISDSTLLSGKLSTTMLEDFFNVKRIPGVGVYHPVSGVVEVLENRLEAWKARCSGTAAVVFMTGQIDFVVYFLYFSWNLLLIGIFSVRRRYLGWITGMYIRSVVIQ
ncbi:hypothetical protein HK096_005597, partial [Nowakowskiella sp. JEL0078]